MYNEWKTPEELNKYFSGFLAIKETEIDHSDKPSRETSNAWGDVRLNALGDDD